MKSSSSVDTSAASARRSRAISVVDVSQAPARATRFVLPLQRLLMVSATPLLCVSAAHAMDFDTGNPDLKLRWDNSVKYSIAFRVRDPSAVLLSDPNQDDGDRDFRKTGLISNRVDLLSDLDIIYKEDFGLRVSGAAWYDTVYNRRNENDSPATVNAISVTPNEFTHATRDQQGRDAEVLDAFVFSKGQIGDVRWGARAGKHSLLWGETLFFGANGIAGGQAPVDLVKLLAVPGSQFKEIIRPVDQLSGSLQLAPDVLIGAYYQLQWEASRLPAVGSYFASQDLFVAGGERFFLGGPILRRGADLEGKNSGQGGLQVRFRLPDGQTDYGLYAIRFNEKTPNLYLNIPLGTYSIAYQDGVKSVGASASRTFGDLNLAGEVSVRHNASLVNIGTANFTGADATADHPLYPVGNTAHANLSTLWTLPSNLLFNEGTFLGEVAWNRRLRVTNGGTMAAESTRDAWALRMQVVPTYRQALAGLDLDVPIGLGYNPQGRSQAVSFFNGGASKGGDASIGLAGNYLNTWKLGLNYTHYFGAAAPALVNGELSFKQSLLDRDFVSLSVQTTF